jgi:hypothetical protein
MRMTAAFAVEAPVTRVLNVSRRVRDNELSRRCREVAVGDVDGDPLLALRLEAIGEEREIDLRPGHLRRAPYRSQLVVVDPVRVVQQPPDERRLAVVHRAHGDEPQEIPLGVDHQK